MGQAESEPQHDASLQSRGIKRMHPHIQRKLRQGTGYNMKIVIRGARETGKTSLLRRLEGKSFIREHYPTPQIQVAHIDWNYKTTNDLVQVEVWDVVDKGITSPKHDARMQELISQGKVNRDALPKFVADATTVDVYKGCHAVLLMLDPTRRWTFEYVQEEMKRIPKGCQILLMANFRDLASRRQVKEVEIENFLRSCEANTNYIECCMMNGFGLKQLYNWLNIPFLLLKQDFLKRELLMADKELKTAQHEAQLVQEQDYGSYLKLVNMQMAMHNRPPIPSQGPIPKCQKPGSIPTRVESPKNKAHKSKTDKKSSGLKVRRNLANPTPKEKPSNPNDEDDLDNFNAGELNAGFFGDEEDDDQDAYEETANEVEAKPSDEDDDLPPEAEDEDDALELEVHDAIQTNAYSATTSKKEKGSPEKEDDDDDSDDERPREKVLALKNPDQNEEDEDQLANDARHTSFETQKAERDTKNEASPPMPHTGIEATKEDSEDDHDSFKPDGGEDELDSADQAVGNDNKNAEDVGTDNFVAPVDNSLKGFYDDDDDDDDDDNDEIDRKKHERKSVASRFKDDSDDEAVKSGFDDQRPRLEEDSTQPSSQDPQTGGGATDGYGEFSEIGGTKSDEFVEKAPKKKKKKKKKSDEEGSKRKKKKKSRRKERVD